MQLIKINLLFLFCFIGSFANAGGNYVGNAGEGFLLKSGEVFLADLFVSGDELNYHPYIGPTPYKKFVDHDFPFSTVPLPRDLILAKLNDISVMNPSLAAMLSDLIPKLVWTFVDGTLGATCDANTTYIDAEKMGATHVQIANRDQMQIRIQRDLWQKMNPQHQTALIFHEAIYSLLAPKPEQQANECKNGVSTTRSIVTRLFSKDILKYPVDSYANLNIYAGTNECRKVALSAQAPVMGISIIMPPPPGELGTPVIIRNPSLDPSITTGSPGEELEINPRDYQNNEVDLSNRIHELCDSLDARVPKGKTLLLKSYRRSYKFIFEGDSVKAVGRNPIGVIGFGWTGSFGCQNLLGRILKPWYSEYVDQVAAPDECARPFDMLYYQP